MFLELSYATEDDTAKVLSWVGSPCVCWRRCSMHIPHINVTMQVSEASVLELITRWCQCAPAGKKGGRAAVLRHGRERLARVWVHLGLVPFALGGPTSSSDHWDKHFHHNNGWRREKQHVNQKANLTSTKKAFEYSKKLSRESHVGLSAGRLKVTEVPG